MPQLKRPVVLSLKNLRLLRDLTGASLRECDKVVRYQREQILQPTYKARILACNDLESLKLNLVKIFNEINPTPNDEILKALEENIEKFEMENEE